MSSCPAGFSYVTTTQVDSQTIIVCSNYPLNQSAPTPSQYIVDVYFSAPVAGIDTKQVEQAVVNAFQQRGYNVTVLAVTVVNPQQLELWLQASSPAPIIIAVIVALALVAIIAVAIYLITVNVKQILTVPSPTAKEAVTAGAIALLIGAVALAAFGIGYLIKQLRGKGA